MAAGDAIERLREARMITPELWSALIGVPMRRACGRAVEQTYWHARQSSLRIHRPPCADSNRSSEKEIAPIIEEYHGV